MNYPVPTTAAASDDCDYSKHIHTLTHTLSDKFLEGLACGCHELKGDSAGAIVAAADGVQIVVGIALVNAIALSLRFTFLGWEL